MAEWGWNNWGTKSDIGVCLVEGCEGKIVYEFDSIGDAPIAWLAQVAELFPTLVFSLDFDEPGLCFKGEAMACDGQLQYEDRDFY